MSSEETRNNDNLYFSIVQGSFRTQVPENHPDVIVREWEAGGKKGVKYERKVDALFGKIENVSFYEGESDSSKFTNINITLDANEDGKNPVISTGVSNRYGQDILKKLPNINLDEEVRIRPFSFIPEGEENAVTGVEITQPDDEGKFTKKVHNFFYDVEAKKPKNGYPVPEGDTTTFDSDDWKVYFIKANKFLKKYAEDNIVPRFAAKPTPAPDYPADEINPNDIPF